MWPLLRFQVAVAQQGLAVPPTPTQPTPVLPHVSPSHSDCLCIYLNLYSLRGVYV